MSYINFVAEMRLIVSSKTSHLSVHGRQKCHTWRQTSKIYEMKRHVCEKLISSLLKLVEIHLG